MHHFLDQPWRRWTILALASVGVVLTTIADSWAQTETGRVLTRKYDFKEAGKEMQYTLYLPKKYDPKSEKQEKFPLIVALHGLGSNPGQIIRYPGLTKHAEKHGYIVVAPMGYNSRGWYGSRGTGGGRGSDPKNLGELSEKDVMNVLAIIRKEFRIEEKKIYLLGHSMGGGGTWHLAIKYPDIWAALAPIAPAIYRKTDELEKIKHIPVIVIQGDKDRLVPVSIARRWVAKMKELEMQHKYIEVANGGHVKIAFDHFPQIFEFFDAHAKMGKREK
jgi:predicted peptidase